MSAVIREFGGASLDGDLLAAPGPLLLDLWAPWCAPCKTLAPILERVAGEYAGALTVAKADVEQHPEILRRFGVRGIPTLLLFEGSVEKARLVGVKSADELRRWLARAGVVPPAAAPAEAAPATPDPSPHGAFHGDPELRGFLLLRLRERAEAGRVEDLPVPRWAGGRGTLAAALVGSTDPRVFVGITGLPASFAAALDFCQPPGPIGAADIDRLFAPIATGADLRRAAPRLALALFDGTLGDWSAIAPDPTLHALRERWVACAARALAGLSVPDAEWQALASEIEVLRGAVDEPERLVHDALVETLVALCPLPAPEDADGWQRALGLFTGRQLQVILARHRLGWTLADQGLERRQHAWFAAREREQPGGRFDAAGLAAAHAAWADGPDGDAQRRASAFHDAHAANLAPVVRACAEVLAHSSIPAPTAPSPHPSA